MKQFKGSIISLEGGEGSGKGTIIELLKKHFGEEDIVFSREPGGIDIAEDIRKIILDKNNTSMDGLTEVLLYASARRQHLVEKIIPALKAGKVVILDRYIDSSLAYQGYARGIGIEKVLKINQFAIENLMPKLTLYLDVPIEIGLNRVSKRGESGDRADRLDLETKDFHQKVRTGYQKLLKKYPDRIKKINANQAIEIVFDEVLRELKR